MPKVKYEGLTFDSDLEVEYYKYLKENSLYSVYHPKVPIQITKGNKYTPDFVVWYSDRVEVVETKGYSQYSYMKDNMIHNLMLQKTESDLKLWLNENGYRTNGLPVYYRKIKFLKAYGFVDWDFKNPNTIANKRKEKITNLNSELKDLKDFKKDAERYFSYLKKLHNNEKLTKSQAAWMLEYEKERGII